MVLRLAVFVVSREGRWWAPAPWRAWSEHSSFSSPDPQPVVDTGTAVADSPIYDFGRVTLEWLLFKPSLKGHPSRVTCRGPLEGSPLKGGLKGDRALRDVLSSFGDRDHLLLCCRAVRLFDLTTLTRVQPWSEHTWITVALHSETFGRTGCAGFWSTPIS